jgi:hypothetical protein
MASFRTIAALSVVTGACILAAMPIASAQTAPIEAAAAPVVVAASQGFRRCPKTSDQYSEVMVELVTSAARARALADENPLLEPDAAFYAAELAATKRCAPSVATLAQ